MINIFILIIVVVFQSIFPVITYGNYKIAPDFLLILLTFYSLKSNRFFSIICGFILGILQDFLSQIELIGAFAFVKSLSGYFVGSLNKYMNFFSKRIILLFIFIIYVIHFFIFYFFKFNNIIFDLYLLFKIIVINSLINLSIYILLDKVLYDKKSFVK